MPKKKLAPPKPTELIKRKEKILANKLHRDEHRIQERKEVKHKAEYYYYLASYLFLEMKKDMAEINKGNKELNEEITKLSKDIKEVRTNLKQKEEPKKVDNKITPKQRKTFLRIKIKPTPYSNDKLNLIGTKKLIKLLENTIYDNEKSEGTTEIVDNEIIIMLRDKADKEE